MKRWREVHGITQAELARRCGVQPNTIARYEQGVHIPRPTLLRKLISITGLDANAILAEVVSPSEQRRGRPKGKPRGRPKGRKRRQS